MLQLRDGSGSLELVLDIAERVVTDVAGASAAEAPSGSAAAPRWPPLDAALAEAALRLLLACHAASAEAGGEAGAQPGPGRAAEANNPQLLLEQGGRALLDGLCDQQVHLTKALCEQLLEAFTAAPQLGQWASARFGDRRVEAIWRRFLGEGRGRLVLRREEQQEQQQEQQQRSGGAAAALFHRHLPRCCAV